MNALPCPRCGKISDELYTVEPATSEYLKARNEAVPSVICVNCTSQLRNAVARTSGVVPKEKAKEGQRLEMWKGRVNVIKKARQAMITREFSEAAANYEKYIRILEIVFEAEPGALKPECFKDASRSNELTIVAGVYWDLLRIYDINSKYINRQENAARQLALFLRYTPIFPSIFKKADEFSRIAKNPGPIKLFIEQASDSKSRCFIATAAFDSPYAEEIFFLQKYRDDVISNKFYGKFFIKSYYVISPTIANALDRYPSLKPPVRYLLRTFIKKVQKESEP
jgi:hypothetical protein